MAEQWTPISSYLNSVKKYYWIMAWVFGAVAVFVSTLSLVNGANLLVVLSIVGGLGLLFVIIAFLVMSSRKKNMVQVSSTGKVKRGEKLFEPSSLISAAHEALYIRNSPYHAQNLLLEYPKEGGRTDKVRISLYHPYMESPAHLNAEEKAALKQFISVQPTIPQTSNSPSADKAFGTVYKILVGKQEAHYLIDNCENLKSFKFTS